MNYIIEAILVGFYSVLIYIFINLLNLKNFFIVLFSCGFIKHFLAYIIGLHALYCKYGSACVSKATNISEETDFIKNKYNIIITSIGEGLLYLLVGSILHIICYNKYVIMFFIGFMLHIIFEILGMHKYFCINYCA